MLKRHLILKQAVDDYANSMQKLADRAHKMMAEDHPDGYASSCLSHTHIHAHTHTFKTFFVSKINDEHTASQARCLLITDENNL